MWASRERERERKRDTIEEKREKWCEQIILSITLTVELISLIHSRLGSIANLFSGWRERQIKFLLMMALSWDDHFLLATTLVENVVDIGTA